MLATAALLLAAMACSSRVEDLPPQAVGDERPAPLASPSPGLLEPAPAADGDTRGRKQRRGEQRPGTERQTETAPEVPVLQPRGPQAATNAARLGRQLAEVEVAIRNPEVLGADLAEAAHLQQVAYRQLALHPRWDSTVLSIVPPKLRYAVRANLRASRELLALSGPPPPELPTWRIVSPAAANALYGFYVEAQNEFGVPWPYLAAIHLVETRMGRIRGTSVAGAQGPMQFIPSTWASYGRGDVNDNRDAILAAGRYLRARGAPNDMDSALFSYNNSTRYVRAVDAYARVMTRDPNAYRGYYHWQVYYNQPGGPVWLPVGYDGRIKDKANGSAKG